MATGLKQIYADLGYVSSNTDFEDDKSDYEDYGTWRDFSQGDFVDENDCNDCGWYNNGKVYIPDDCSSQPASESCKVHVAFHGCEG